MELKACEPVCSCCQEDKGVNLIIIADKEYYFQNVREYEISTFVDYFRRTRKVKQVQITY